SVLIDLEASVFDSRSAVLFIRKGDSLNLRCTVQYGRLCDLSSYFNCFVIQGYKLAVWLMEMASGFALSVLFLSEIVP
ncbi:hypothetical protein, partial [Vibrio parahaemolyticus]|uniref:hypothetical protein n=1 Tax=Vibrio parahaemolyticus TaxID=670 RepID=UPI001E40A43A